MATVQARLGDWEASLREVKPWLAGALRTLRAAGRGQRQRTGPPFPPRPAAHPGPWPNRPRSGEGDFAARSGTRQPPTSKRSTAWASSGAWRTARCRRRSSPTTSPRTPSTSTAIRASWRGPAPWPPPRPNSCSGPGPRSSASKSSRSCTAAGSAPGGCGGSWARSPRPTWTICWLPRHPAATPCWWPRSCRASGSMPTSGRASTREFVAAGAPAGHPYAEWLRTYADEDFAAPRGRPSASPMRPGAAASAASGRPWSRPSGSPAATRWNSSTRRASTADRDGGPSRYDRSRTVTEVGAAGPCGAYHGQPAETSLICGRRQN